MSRRIPLTRLEPNSRARIVEIQAGQGLIRRLEALGIRVGQSVETVSGTFMRGPVTVQVGSAQLAIGFGMAKRIIVEVG